MYIVICLIYTLIHSITTWGLLCLVQNYGNKCQRQSDTGVLGANHPNRPSAHRLTGWALPTGMWHLLPFVAERGSRRTATPCHSNRHLWAAMSDRFRSAHGNEAFLYGSWMIQQSIGMIWMHRLPSHPIRMCLTHSWLKITYQQLSYYLPPLSSGAPLCVGRHLLQAFQ